jgi:hypothetical protein
VSTTAGDDGAESGDDEETGQSPLAVAVPVFAVVVTFAAVAYPFVVITGAILTIPVLAVTTLVTTRVAGG